MIDNQNKWVGLTLVIIGYVLITLAIIMFEVGITQIYALNEYEDMTGLSAILPPTGIIAYMFFISLGLLTLVEGTRENIKNAISGNWMDNIIISFMGMITIAITFILYPVFFERLEELITLLEG